MRTFFIALGVSVILFGLSASIYAQGDVRSATGLPIPIGEPVVWGQVELRGLKQNEARPSVVVTLVVNGAQIANAHADDRGYYVFRRVRVSQGSVLQVTVGGLDVGRQMISPGSGDRYDMTVDWGEGSRNAAPGVVSARNAYSGRNERNAKLFEQASAAARSKDKAKAIKLFKELVTADPNDFVAWTELGSLYFEDKKQSDAISSYERAISLKPDYMVAMMNLGKLHLAEKDYGKAIAVFEKAVAADSGFADAHHYLGEAYLQNKQGSKAVGVLNEAIRLAPIEKADIHLRLATLYNAANLKDRAVNEYKLFLEKRPNHPERSTLEKYIKDNQ